MWKKYEKGENLTPKSANFDTFYPKKCNFSIFTPEFANFCYFSTKNANLDNFFPNKCNFGQFSTSESKNRGKFFHNFFVDWGKNGFF